MDTLHIAKTALRTLFDHKRLWLFGFFVAAGSGSSFSYSGDGEMPAWAVGLLIGTLVLACVGLFLHILSESALIESVRVAWLQGDVQLGSGARQGMRRFVPVLAIKALAGGAMLLSVAAIAAPALLAAFHVLPAWLGISLTTLLAVPAVPWLLTLYLVHVWALRFAVLDNQGAVSSLRAASRFLRGRLAPSLRLLLVNGLAHLAGALLSLVVAIPALLLGIGVYSFAGLVPAIVAGAVFALPFAVVVVGASGTFRSSLWTLSFLEAQGGLQDLDA